MPRVSVLMTIYNPGPFLALALDSLLAQSYPDFELVAVENGSTDGAAKIIVDYAARDKRINVIALPENIGRTPALNLALEAAQGEYVAVLDADDVARSDRLARSIEALDANPDAVLLASYVRKIDDNGAVIGRFEPPSDTEAVMDAFAHSNPVSHSSAMFRRAVAMAVGGYPAQYRFAQDFALWLTLIQRGKVVIVKETLADIREHSSQATLSRSFSGLRHTERLELFRKTIRSKKYVGRVRQLAMNNLAELYRENAKYLFRTGRPFSACGQWSLAFMTAPGMALRKAFAKFARIVTGWLRQSRARNVDAG